MSPPTPVILLRHLVLFVLVFSSEQVWSYRRNDQIQADINQLYDTKPTSLSPNGDMNKASGSKAVYKGSSRSSSTASAPYFDLNYSGNVTAAVETTGLLNCRVKNIGNKTVSWIRHSDTHHSDVQLLTIGRLTYTSDLRFKAIHKMFSEDYLLQIKPVTHRDAGLYECQISTTPPTSHIVALQVAEPHTAILGGPDIHLKEGSTMNLTCVITDSPEPPTYIFWRHNDAIISYDSPRGGVSVIVEKGEQTSSFLVIQHARPSDSGNYSCAPSVGEMVSVNVHVLRGEFIRARTGSSGPMLQPSLAVLLLAAATLLAKA